MLHFYVTLGCQKKRTTTVEQGKTFSGDNKILFMCPENSHKCDSIHEWKDNKVLMAIRQNMIIIFQSNFTKRDPTSLIKNI